jgi:hypothetical protein
MPRATDLFGLAGAACATAALLLALPGVARLRAARPFPALLAALALSLLPLGTLSAAGYVRGIVADLSVTTTLLLLHHLLRPVLGLAAIDERSRIALQALVAASGVLLYPLTLGFGPADPYRLGFAHAGFVVALLLLAAGAWLGRMLFVASCVALAVLAWASGIGESRNLWDYLLDPLVAAWGTGALAWKVATALRSSSAPRGLPGGPIAAGRARRQNVRPDWRGPDPVE